MANSNRIIAVPHTTRGNGNGKSNGKPKPVDPETNALELHETARLQAHAVSRHAKELDELGKTLAKAVGPSLLDFLRCLRVAQTSERRADRAAGVRPRIALRGMRQMEKDVPRIGPLCKALFTLVDLYPPEKR